MLVCVLFLLWVVVVVVVVAAVVAVVVLLLLLVVVVVVSVLVLVKSRQFGTHLFPLGKGPKNQQHTTPGVPRQCEPTRGHRR